MRILYVDNEPTGVEDFKHLAETRLGADCRIVSFDKASETIGTFKPDIVVLDLVQDPDEPASAGMPQLRTIWEGRFCPIIVYSAFPERFTEEATEEMAQHPFVALVKKGSGSDLQGCECAKRFAGHIAALHAVDNAFSQAIHQTLRYLAPFAFQVMDEKSRDAFLVRAARRRVAAMMDVGHESEGALACWEHYIYPPCDRNLLLGDVIYRRDEGWDNPEAFRLVLTPSCDIAQAKVTEVLVAKCKGAAHFVEILGLADASAEKLREKLPKSLSSGHALACIPLPPFQGKLPAMTADLRDLELVSLKSIEPNGREFERVVSMDSPFRELVAWAYMQTCGRPGLPDRDVKAWSEEIIKEVNKAEEGG